MRLGRRGFVVVAAIALLFYIYLRSYPFAHEAVVTKVIDGDTIVVQGGESVRLLGIDADERGYPCYTQAKKRLEELILGKTVSLERDKEDRDIYGRLLRYVFADGFNINAKLAEEGLVIARLQGDSKYKFEIAEAEKFAMENKMGCKWQA